MTESRLQQLRTFMAAHQLDAAIITLPKHVYYLTGFFSEPHERFLGLIIPSDGEPTLVVPALDREAAEQASSVKQIATHSDTDNPYEVVKRLLKGRLQRVGLEKSHLTVNRYEALAAALEAETYVDLEAPLQEMRMIKSPDEVARIRKAIDVVEKVLAEGLKKVKAGVTELELVAELEYLMKRMGAEGPSFSTMVLAGENSALPHGHPGDRTIREGELLLFDMGVALDGYVSDITRTFAVGEINERQKEIYQTVLAANLAAIEAVRPGAALASLDKTARDLIAAKGYGEYFTHRLGHGMGMDVHEYPSVHGKNQDALRPGMVFTIEPGIYLPGVGGVRIEDNVLVTETGCEVLTSFPKELTVIG
ncbi:aminopeptidase P family protein [Brevibacillus sp. SYP-B805]|uniref:M24 family metallopeptidase n=1 Tax=Brevibacillus sp. SYP-B805 TaxID=1578199 RepID=UPI0013EDC543|nr:Xaa-Pro peptidase family protein [Brevibacillus sp. SYP-B805]NGQ94150.1 aminopeptidase P family protein [Brevibacillus sp. SYP-B805]